MAWPFGKKRPTAPEPGKATARAAPEDQAVLDDALTWLRTHAPAHPAHQPGPEPLLHVGAPPNGVRTSAPAPAGAVLRAKKGKLAWIDLYDPALREPLNQLIKHLDRQQKWYFNGVVSTRYEEPTGKDRGVT